MATEQFHGIDIETAAGGAASGNLHVIICTKLDNRATLLSLNLLRHVVASADLPIYCMLKWDRHS